MTNAINGSKYETTKSLDIAEIAKLVRADLKAAEKSGEIPAGTKCRVMIARFAGGCSVHVAIDSCPVQIWTDEFVAAGGWDSDFDGDPMTSESTELVEKIDGYLQAYNRRDCDSQTDYFSVRFYGDAALSSDARARDFAATQARIAKSS